MDNSGNMYRELEQFMQGGNDSRVDRAAALTTHDLEEIRAQYETCYRAVLARITR